MELIRWYTSSEQYLCNWMRYQRLLALRVKVIPLPAGKALHMRDILLDTFFMDLSCSRQGLAVKGAVLVLVAIHY